MPVGCENVELESRIYKESRTHDLSKTGGRGRKRPSVAVEFEACVAA
jgi:hypothetical protein